MNRCAVLIVAFILMVGVPASAQQIRVNHNRTPLRAEPTQTSTALAFYQAGSALDIISLNDGWYKVRDPKTKQEGFILASLVDVLPGSPRPQPAPAAAQPATSKPPAKSPTAKAKGWTDRGFIGIGAVYQAGSPAFSTEYSYTEFLEPVTATTDYPATKGPGFNVGGAVRVWRSLALGVSVTGARRSSDATVSASIPHPFYFNTGRPVTGTVSVTRSEYAAHFHALWVIPAGRRLLIAVGGGPTYFSVTQSLVESFRYTESYPYDSATFSSATVNDASASAVGIGATLDIAYYFSRYIGVGGTVRYSSATVSFSSHDSTVTSDAGGFEAGLGLRVRFPKGAPKKAPAKPPAAPKPAKK